MSTVTKWETLACEAIADAGYWKAEARKAQGQRDALLAALREVTDRYEALDKRLLTMADGSQKHHEPNGTVSRARAAIAKAMEVQS